MTGAEGEKGKGRLIKREASRLRRRRTDEKGGGHRADWGLTMTKRPGEEKS
jgi:hypothetical protein